MGYFPKLHHKQEEILTLILQQFKERVQPAVSMDNYVVDFLLCVPKEEQFTGRTNRFDNLHIWVVELNPLAEFAGTGMFTWEYDRDILLGKKPFEFRIQTRVLPEAIQNVSSEIRKFLVC